MRLVAISRHHRKTCAGARRPVLEARAISLPDPLPPFLDGIPRLELGEQRRGQEVRRQVAGAHVRPCVFVHEASEETAAVRALLAKDLGPVHELRIVDEKGSALTAAEVLGLVKALRRQAAERAELLAAIPAEEAVGWQSSRTTPTALSDRH